MTTIQFYFRPSKSLRHSKGIIYVRVTHNKRVSCASTSLKVYPEEWNKKQSCIVYPKEDTLRQEKLYGVEKELKRIRLFLEKAIEAAKSTSSQFRCSEVMNSYRQQGNLLSVVTEKLCEELEENEQYEKSHAYRIVLEELIRFINNDRIEVKQLTAKLIHDYEKSLCRQRMEPDVILSYIRNLTMIYKAVVRDGLKKSILSKTHGYEYGGIETTHKNFMTQWEIKSPKLQKSRSVGNRNYHILAKKGLYVPALVVKEQALLPLNSENRDSTSRKREVAYFSSLESIIS